MDVIRHILDEQMDTLRALPQPGCCRLGTGYWVQLPTHQRHHMQGSAGMIYISVQQTGPDKNKIIAKDGGYGTHCSKLTPVAS